ncbi:MAG TPA: RDD family protein [Candidatus Brachybacterium merdavium]|uniref:RDD family protein n=1 Tax=Candidatus Brachybacterium merdavium TaxID=2838513 RepID=A0A9D2LCI8_9MICO|nr:RDD family protein [Candidatus Brachybacterium merdavium]
MASTSTAGTDREALITGDAVLLDLRTASFAVRMVSAAIDGALQLAILIGGVVALAWTAARADLDQGLIAAAVLVMSVTAYVGYPVLSELLLRGRSVGRLVMGTRVVRDDGGPAHLRQSLIRAVMAMLEIWSTAGTLALTSSVIDRRSRRIGDLLAGTMVIQERMRTIEPRRPAVPVDLQQWAGSADVGRLPVTLMADIRSFLPRTEQTNPESRRLLSRDLVQRTLPHVAPAPPPGTDPEAFLAAVIAERSRRDEQRLRIAQGRRHELSAEVRAVPFTA